MHYIPLLLTLARAPDNAKSRPGAQSKQESLPGGSLSETGRRPSPAWRGEAQPGPSVMQFAIAIPTDAASWKLVRRAEELGFSRAWFYDTQMLSADPFVAMAAAAMKTTKIRLGTGVLVPSNRIGPVVANAIASLIKLSPVRIHL